MVQYINIVYCNCMYICTVYTFFSLELLWNNHQTIQSMAGWQMTFSVSYCSSALCHIIFDMNSSVSVRADFPLDTRIDSKQMRRSCRTAGVHAVSAAPWLLHPSSLLYTAVHQTRVSRASPSTQPRPCPPFPQFLRQDSFLSRHATSWPPPSTRAPPPAVIRPTSYCH